MVAAAGEAADATQAAAALGGGALRCRSVARMRLPLTLAPLHALSSGGRGRGGERASAPPAPRRAPPAPPAAAPLPTEPDSAANGAAGRRRAAAANHLLNFSYAAPARAGGGAPPASQRPRHTSHANPPASSVARLRADRQRKDLFLQARPPLQLPPCCTLLASNLLLSPGALSVRASRCGFAAPARLRRSRVRRHDGVVGRRGVGRGRH